MLDLGEILTVTQNDYMTAGEVKKLTKSKETTKEVQDKLEGMFNSGYLDRRYRIRTWEYRATVRPDIFDPPNGKFVDSLFKTPLPVLDRNE